MKKFWADRWCRLFLLLLAAIIVWQSLVPPIVGLADNGDFYVVFLPFGLNAGAPASGDERYFGYLVTDYYFPGIQPEARLFTTEWVLFLPGFLLTPLLSKVNHYDLRMAGITHAAVYLTAFALMLPFLARRRKWWVPVFALLVACDVHYVSHFNSLYTDVASLLFLLLSVALYMRLAEGTASAKRDALLLLLCLLLFVGSKAQHAILMVPIAAFLIWKRTIFKPYGSKVVAATALAVVVLGTVCLKWTPPEYRMIPYYTTVFNGLLPAHPDPKALLKELGLPQEFTVYAGTNAYMPDSGMATDSARKRFESSVSWPRLVLYYASHPIETWRRLRSGLNEGAMLRPNWGNFPKDAGYAPGARSTAFSIWSYIRIKVFEEAPDWFFFYTLLISAAAVFLAAKTGPHWRDGAILLVGILWIELLVSTLADALETTRHLFLFNSILDLLAIAVLAGIARLVHIRSNKVHDLV